ncbi:MAG: hypothetical protein WBA44_05210 [Mesorhizobium sp.]
MSRHSFPPRGDFTIPERADYQRFSPQADAGELIAIVKTQVDYARMCLDNDRADMAETSLKTIWSYADAVEQKLN